jgi:hypothetical protein
VVRTTAVARDVAVKDPSAFRAVTATRTRFPTLPAVSVYVLPVAPEMSTQLLPAVSHSRHWYA